MKLRLKFRESTLEKSRIFLINAQRRLDIILRGNWPAQFLRNAHCGFTEKSTVQQKLHIPRGNKLQRPSEPDYKHQNFGLLEFWNVLFILVFTLLKTFCHCMHLESGISILWVGFFTTQELTHLMSHPCGAPLIDSIVYFPVVSSGILLAAFSLGMLTCPKASTKNHADKSVNH